MAFVEEIIKHLFVSFWYSQLLQSTEINHIYVMVTGGLKLKLTSK